MQNYYYLIEFQFLGFRYHGWQKQPNVKTVQGMVDKTFCFIFDHDNFKTLGASRTDAMVSANHAVFELFTREPYDPDWLLEQLDQNLPNDIRATKIEAVNGDFNIIQHAKTKEYLYLFSFGARHHPFSAPFMVYMRENLDVSLMMEGAKKFEGTHSFQRYCHKPSAKTVFEREILLSEIVKNDVYTANFFPENSFLFRVIGKGFMRHQVRLMMGTLFDLGRGVLTIEDIEMSLKPSSGAGGEPLSFIAPASGLILNDVRFEQ